MAADARPSGTPGRASRASATSAVPATLAANAARTQNIGSFAIIARSLFTPSQAATTASAPSDPAASATT